MQAILLLFLFFLLAFYLFCLVGFYFLVYQYPGQAKHPQIKWPPGLCRSILHFLNKKIHSEKTDMMTPDETRLTR